MSGPVNDAGQPVLLFEHATASGHVLAEARLNAEKTLNSLSLPMIEILHPALNRWAADDRVVGVLITGSGDRAFSAGGDIQALYHAMVRNHEAGETVDPYPERFFEEEYRLDYRIHTYPKPVISVGHGVVMGGGLGVFSGAAFRVVTETSRIALPEVSIGLFPDAGATWLLRSLPRHAATFIAMTGAHLNGADALALGMGTHAVATAERDRVREALLALSWQQDAAADRAAVGEALAALPEPDLPESRIDVVPDSLSADGGLAAAVARVRALAGTSDWVDGAIDTMNRGCPASVGVVVEQLARAPALSIGDCFRLEMVVATQCALHRDFAEGVRARLIDKDNQPAWRFDSVETLPAAYVAEHFEAPWPRNPLHDLEATS